MEAYGEAGMDCAEINGNFRTQTEDGGFGGTRLTRSASLNRT